MSARGPIYNALKQKLNVLNPIFLEIFDDSAKHAGHAAMKGLSPKETHFRIVIVSDVFEGHKLLKRHRIIHDVIGDGLMGIHALSIQAKTPNE